MQLKTVIIPKVQKKPKNKKDKVIYALFLCFEILWNTIIPFALGCYFILTKNILWLVLLILFMFIHIEINYQEKELMIKVVRAG